MRVVNVIVPALWIAVGIYWLASSARAKATQTRSRSFIAIRLAAVVLILVFIQTGVFRGHAAATRNPWLQGIGLVVVLVGLAVAVWARVYLGRNWGMPMSEKVDAQLVTTGPYRYVRHPIYSGLIMGLIGTALAISTYWIVGAVVLGAYFIYSATVEEHTMEHLFPDEYPAYKRSTKMLIPFIF